MQKLYCYVDESGQDVTSKFFVVVAVLVFAEDRITLQDRLLGLMEGSSISARVYVDGINKTIARALTNALRSRGISLTMIKGKRDENEPLIRLADMWAGCIRSALLQKFDAQEIFERAQKEEYLVEIKTQNPR